MTTQLSGIGGFSIAAPPVLSGQGAPASTLKGVVGQNYVDLSANPRQEYFYDGINWQQISSSSSGALEYVVGTANEITVTTTGDTATVSLPSAITTPGSLTTTTTLTGGTGITATTGDIVASAGAVTATNTGTNRAIIGDTSGGTGVTATLTSSGATVDALELVGGSIKVPAGTNTPGASPQTLNARTGTVVYTDVIPTSGAVDFVMNNSFVTTSSQILASVSCATAAAICIMDYIQYAAGSATFQVNNTGTGDTADDVYITFWVLN